MARNEEKQQGRLNRLWLQRQREEGRLRDAHEKRPKLATLNSAASVKKWIPSIKSEIEYCLQQSQLTHYPDRKISEFQLHIEALEKEYKSFIAKLRVLDPSCKHKPWTPRAYCRRRAETQEPAKVKNQRHIDLNQTYDHCGEHESDFDSKWTNWQKPSATETLEPLNYSETRFLTPGPNHLILKTSERSCSNQDQPLSFDHTKLAVATAAFRGSSVHPSCSQTHNLARVLQTGLPNLCNLPSGNISLLKSTDTVNSYESEIQEQRSDCSAAQRIPEKSSNNTTPAESTGHLLGLDYYSSSDDDCDT